MADPTYDFSWQNPVLRKTIYPFREEKLRDFLLIYKEVDLWARMKSLDASSPEVTERLKQIEIEITAERKRVDERVAAALQERIQTDKWFAKITGINEKNLRFKQTYYLDRMILDTTKRLADLEANQKAMLGRVAWYPAGDARQKMWQDRAAELDSPIQAVRQEFDSLSQLRSLFEEQARLPLVDPKKPLTTVDLARMDLSVYEKELKTLSHDQLVEAAWELLNSTWPDGRPRFEKWLRYMVIHFSGMRYQSAHASWADPDDLLELLIREDLKGKLAPGEDIDERTEAEIKRLLALPADANTRNFSAVLKALVYYRQQKERQGEPMPDWVWDEVVKYTQLRLGVTDEKWEAISPERYRYENFRWKSIMDTWQRRDITIWRKEHQQTLELIVTRAVCNEIAEHIQALRGNIPAAGLASKPFWYQRLEKSTAQIPSNDPQKCFFRHSAKTGDFANGASIFWLGWSEVQPNAWQLAKAMTGIDLWPGVKLFDAPASQPGSWSYKFLGGYFTRFMKIVPQMPTAQELRRKGMTEREIEQYRKTLRAQTTTEKEYLRWKHEATVVDVVERIDGRYILTFETGKIGLNWHRLEAMTQNTIDQIFIGYLPKAKQEPPNLDAMLDGDKILTFTRDLLPPGAEETQPPAPEGYFLPPVVWPETAVAKAPKYYVYLVSNRSRKSLYCGVTSDPILRMYQHRQGLVPEAPKRKKFNRLVYYQAFETLAEAEVMQAMVEQLTDSQKKDLIKKTNPSWRDLSDEFGAPQIDFHDAAGAVKP